MKVFPKRSNDSLKVISWGLRNTNTYEIAKKENPTFLFDVWLGKKNNVNGYLKEDMYITINKNELKNLKVALKYDGPLKAPVLKDEKIGDLERIMTNLLEYVFLVRNLKDLTPEKISNAPKKARLYREFDKIIFHLMNRSKLISFLLKVSHRVKESNSFYELSQLLQQMPSKDKLTEAALMNHLISPYKKII